MLASLWTVLASALLCTQTNILHSMHVVSHNFMLMQERAQESQVAEQALSDSDDEAGQPSLQDAYSMILEQAGLHGDALQTALDSWMDLVTGVISVMANNLVRGRIPSSHAAQLVIQKKLATAVIMVAGKLSPAEFNFGNTW